jgi:hypothetical protein
LSPAVVALGGELALGFHLPTGAGPARAAAGTAAVSAWVVIQPGDAVVIRVARSEMGQGITTALPMLVVLRRAGSRRPRALPDGAGARHTARNPWGASVTSRVSLPDRETRGKFFSEPVSHKKSKDISYLPQRSDDRLTPRQGNSRETSQRLRRGTSCRVAVSQGDADGLGVMGTGGYQVHVRPLSVSNTSAVAWHAEAEPFGPCDTITTG